MRRTMTWMGVAATALACLGCTGAFLEGRYWDQAHSDRRNTGFNAVRTVDVTDATLRWAAEVGPLVTSAPVIGASGVVHVGNFAGEAVGINPDGTLRFRRRLGEHIRATPALDPESGELVYVVQNPVSPTAFGSFLYRVSPEGETLASSAVDVHTTGPAKIWRDYVFVTDRAYAYVFNRVTLELVARQWLWTGHCTALVCAGENFFATLADVIACMIPFVPAQCADKFYMDGPVSEPAVAVLDGPTFVDNPDEPLIVVTNQHCASAWRFRPAAPFEERLQYAWDRRYVQITCSSPERLLPTSPAVLADGRVVFGNQVGHVVALDAATGEQLWFLDVPGSVQSPPVGSLRQIHVVGRNRLIVLDSDGATISERPLLGIGNAAALSLDRVYVVTSEGVHSFPLDFTGAGTFVALPTGVEPHAPVQAGVAIGRDGTVYVSTPGGWIRAYGP
jgi:outer membrane protein assembly factor BamB